MEPDEFDLDLQKKLKAREEYYCLDLDTLEVVYLGLFPDIDDAEEVADKMGHSYIWILDRATVCKMLKSGVDALHQEAMSRLA